MLRENEALAGLFDPPSLFFTVNGGKIRNPRSSAVIQELAKRVTVPCQVLATPEAVKERFQSGTSPSSAVVLYDDSYTAHFSPTTASRPKSEIPSWAQGAQWGVRVGETAGSERLHNCANQTAADFHRRFSQQILDGQYPWGPPRKGEPVSRQVTLPNGVADVLTALNSGPDFAASIAEHTHRAELPFGSRISWLRVSPQPLQADTERLTEVVLGFEQFEEVSQQLLESKSEIADQLLAGVSLDPSLRGVYLSPRTNHFSVRRPDLHLTSEGVFASENDEMPGGFPECFHLDRSYGVNQDRWKRALQWLTEYGTLLFLVSSKWSACYIPELRWLTEQLQAAGYPVQLLATDQLEQLQITDQGLSLNGEPVSTVWRQFPIFESEGKLAEVVLAAQLGLVRLVPEFAHFGNKTWFSLFREYRQFYCNRIEPSAFRLLDEILPDSHLVQSAQDFPCLVGGQLIQDLEELRNLPEAQRNRLVMKVAGANTLSARMYGVLMGHGLTLQTWRNWIDERFTNQQPFIIQRRLETRVLTLPVFNTQLDRPEAFNCRVLVRPWTIGPELVSASFCAVPSNTLRVHGRVDMCLGSVDLG